MNIVSTVTLRDLWNNCIVFLAYVISGYIALTYVATPELYDVIIWPPAGIALASILIWGKRILPALILASIAIIPFFNFRLPGEPGPLITATFNVLVASGAVFQAIAGRLVIKKALGLDNPLLLSRDIILFAIISGPVISIINSTCSIFAITVFKVNLPQDIAYSWLSCWSDETLGNLIFGPLWLILFSKPRTIWKRRITQIFIPMSIVIMMLVSGYTYINSLEIMKIRNTFYNLISSDALRFSANIAKTDGLLDTAAAYFSSDGEVTANKFADFSQSLLHATPYMETLAWIATQGDSSHQYSIPEITFFNASNTLLTEENTKSVLKRHYSDFFKKTPTTSHAKLIAAQFFDASSTSAKLYFLKPVFKGQQVFGYIFVSSNLNRLANHILSTHEPFTHFTIKTDQGTLLYDYDYHHLHPDISFDDSLYKQQIELHEIPENSPWNITASPSKSFVKKHYSGKVVIIYEMGMIFCALMNIALFLLFSEKSIIESTVEKQAIALRDEQEKLYQLAHFDTLTCLPNRFNFFKQLTASIETNSRDGELLAVCFIDIDNFKWVNDTQGHTAGDLALKEAATLLKETLRDTDFIARLGGDEFGIIINGASNIKSLKKIASHLIASINSPKAIERIGHDISVSVGIASYPDMGKNSDELLKNADIAMYHAKFSGKNKYALYEENLSKRIHRRHQITKALRSALHNQEMTLHFQPQINLIDEDIIGVEVLLRWHNPQLGNISPNEFISISEENGLIQPIGQWVLEKSAKIFSELNQRHPGIILSINVSMRQFENPSFITLLKSTLSQYSVPLNQICLEITETAAMKDLNQFKKIMGDLEPLGIKIALDDFGTGYASLKQLPDIPLSQLKIDQSFIHNCNTCPKTRAIIEAIIQLGRGLGAAVIAEGVENLDQLRYLQSKNCHLIQGYYFTPPLAINDLFVWSDQYRQSCKPKVIEHDTT